MAFCDADRPTSVGDDPHVGLDEPHVDAVLLLPDDDRPPQPHVLPLLLGAVRGDGIMWLAGAPPAGRTGLWQRTQNDVHSTDTFVIELLPVSTGTRGRSQPGTHLPSPSRGRCSQGSPPPPACPARPRRCPGRLASRRGRLRSGLATG